MGPLRCCLSHRFVFPKMQSPLSLGFWDDLILDEEALVDEENVEFREQRFIELDLNLDYAELPKSDVISLSDKVDTYFSTTHFPC